MSPVATTAESRQQDSGSVTRVAIALFLLLAAIYLLSYRGISHSPDEWRFLNQTEQLVQGQWIGVSEHGFLFSVLMAPLFYLSRLAPTFGAYQTALLINIIATAATGVLLLLLVMDLGYARNIAVITAFAYGLGTIAWPYSGYLFREPVAAMWLLMAVWALVRFGQQGRWIYVLLAWLAVGASVLVKDNTLALAPFYAGYFIYLLRKDRIPAWLWEDKWDWRKIAALILFLLVLILYLRLAWPTLNSYIIKGRLVPDLKALYGFFLSPGFGLWWYAPIIFLAGWGIWLFTRAHVAEAIFILGGSLFYILLATRHSLWWGVWNWGPRQLVPLLPFLALPLAALLDSWKESRWRLLLVGIFLVLSIGINVVGITSVFFSYVYETVFLGGVPELTFVWSWKYFPLANLLPFIRLENMSLAWLTDTGGEISIFKRLLLLQLLVFLLAALFFLYSLRRRSGEWRWRLGASAMVLLLVLAALTTLHLVYADSDYGGERGYIEAAQILREEGRPGDLVLTDLWGEDLYLPKVALMNYCKGECPERIDLIREAFIQTNPGWKQDLAALVEPAARVWIVLDRIPEDVPERYLEQGLEDLGYWIRSSWTGSGVRMVLYSTAADKALLDEQLQAIWEQSIRLNNIRIASTSQAPLAAGDTLHVLLEWEALQPVSSDLAISLQLFDDKGQIVAQVDRQPRSGLAPTSSWMPHQIVQDRLALQIPAGIPTGAYDLRLVLYEPTTQRRWQLASGDDALLLFQLQIGQE